VKWFDRRWAKARLRSRRQSLARSERGPVALWKHRRQRYIEKGRFDQPDRSGKTTGLIRWSPTAASTADHDNLSVQRKAGESVGHPLSQEGRTVNLRDRTQVPLD